ncbi:MFS transporter [Ilumatobacter sp.]|uniref:MFS transporter n=1 Tax=Ilumatobacter sp. TaxID=1967498 RepID=UPI003B529733
MAIDERGGAPAGLGTSRAAALDGVIADDAPSSATTAATTPESGPVLGEVGVGSSVGDDHDRAYARRLLITVIGGLIVFSSSMTIVSASLPTMADDLDSTESFLSWSVTGLFLVMAVGTPVLGRLGDIHGHRRVFLIGSIVLSVGTILCGLAPTALAFVAARMVVGLGIATTMPNAMALIMSAYPSSRRSEAMGWFQMAMTGAPVIGLVVGGPLIDLFGWRILFAILAPISFAGFAAAWKVIRPSTPGEPVPIDWAGAGALAVATLGFLLFLERGSSAGFGDALALVLAATSALGLAAFVAVERRAPRPMLRLDYFSRRDFTGPLIAQPLSQFAYMGAFLVAPLLLDELFGYTVGIIALILLARPLVYSVSSPIGGRLAVTIGPRSMILAGSILMVLSMAVWVLGARWTNLWLIVLGLVLSGLAMGLASPSYATTIAGAVDDGDLGIANAMGTTMMNIGMLTGIQAMFVVLGDGRGPDDFAIVFGFGAVVTAFGLIGGLMITPGPAERAEPAVAA